MAIVMRHTSPTVGDIFVHDDDSVTNVAGGSPNTTAIVSHYDGNGVDTIRVDINGNGMIDVNPQPTIMDVRIVRTEGWQGSLGYTCILEDFKEGMDPGVLALAVYSSPDGMGYLYTTGGFVWLEEYQRYGAICPAGHEPAEGAPIYFGMLYGSTPYSTFTMQPQWEEQTFSCGGSEGTVPTQIAEWVKPTGAHDAYNIGDNVLFEGNQYESKINANVWSPIVYPSGWLLI